MGNFQKVEILVYTLVWVSSVLYSIICFTRQSSKYFANYTDEYDDFDVGFLGKPKDVVDLEWKTMQYLFNKIWIWIILKLFLSELKIVQWLKIRKLLEITITVLFVFIHLSPKVLLGILVQPFLFGIVYCISMRKAFLWITNIIIILIISLYKLNESEISNQEEQYLHILALYWTNLRTFSFFMEQKPGTKISVLDMLSFCLYLPVLFNGPFIFYSDYDQRTTSDLKKRCIQILKNTGRFMFWFLFIEFFLQFIYINATRFHQQQLVKPLDGWALYGYGYLMGQFFHMKYLVVYGMSTSIAKFDDIPVPALPKCIGRIHLYSDMWKYFDSGLYKFLLRYIYVPTLQYSNGNKLLGSFLCFTFVYIWHGLDIDILIWVILNFLGIVIENCVSSFYKIYLKDLEITAYLGINSVRRITCFLASFLLAMSAISNFYFFAGMDIGTIFFTRVLEDTYKSNALLILALYCCCQISTELQRIPDQKTKCKRN